MATDESAVHAERSISGTASRPDSSRMPVVKDNEGRGSEGHEEGRGYITRKNLDGASASHDERQKEDVEERIELIRRMCREHGVEHPKTLAALSKLAATYRSLERYLEAAVLDVRVLQTTTEALGSGHTSTIDATIDLACTYRGAAQLADAHQLFERALQSITERLPSMTHHTSYDARELFIRSQIATILGDQGKWKESQVLLQQILDARQHTLDATDPRTLTCLSNLASTYQHLSDLPNAETLATQASEGLQMKLGDTHVTTCQALSNLSSIYWDQGRFEEAEEIEKRILIFRKEELGPQHPDTFRSMIDLASTYWSQGRFTEAKILEQQAVNGLEQLLGPEHPSTITSKANLAATHLTLGEHEEALKLQLQVSNQLNSKLGAEHPDTLTALNNLANIYAKQKDWAKAEACFTRIVDISGARWGTTHPSTLIYMANLSSCYRYQGKREVGLSTEEHVLRPRDLSMGREHPLTMQSLAKIAEMNLLTSQWSEAKRFLMLALGLRKKNYGHASALVVNTTFFLAWTHRKLGEWQRTMALLQELGLRSQHQGMSGARVTTMSIRLLALTCEAAGKVEEALNMGYGMYPGGKQALTSSRRSSSFSEERLDAMKFMAILYDRNERQEEAITIQEKLVFQLQYKSRAHREYFDAMSFLAFHYQYGHRPEESIAVQKRLVARLERDGGRRQFSIFIAENFLALFLECNELKEEAINLQEDAVSGLWKTLGAKHTLTRIGRGFLEFLCRGRYDRKTARALLDRLRGEDIASEDNESGEGRSEIGESNFFVQERARILGSTKGHGKDPDAQDQEIYDLTFNHSKEDFYALLC